MIPTTKDVANFYTDLYRDQGFPLSESKLQALIHLAQQESAERLGLEISCEEPAGDYDIHIFTTEQLEMLMDVDTHCRRYAYEIPNLVHAPIPTYFRNAVAGLPTEGRIDERGRSILPEDWE